MIPENEIEFLEGLMKAAPTFLDSKMPIQIQGMAADEFAARWNSTLNLLLMSAFTKRVSPAATFRSISSMICCFVTAFQEEDKVFDLFLRGVQAMYQDTKEIERKMKEGSLPEGNESA